MFWVECLGMYAWIKSKAYPRSEPHQRPEDLARYKTLTRPSHEGRHAPAL